MSLEVSKIDEVKINKQKNLQPPKKKKQQAVSILEQELKEMAKYENLPNNSQNFLEGINYLESNVNEAFNNYLSYDKGFLGSVANGFKEIFNYETAQSNVDKIIWEEKRNTQELVNTAKTCPHRFRAKFKVQRGVDFSLENIKSFEAKKEEFAFISAFSETKNNFDKKLENSLKKYEVYKDRKRPSGGHDRVNYDKTLQDLKSNFKEALDEIYNDEKLAQDHIEQTAQKLKIDLNKKMTKEQELKAWGKIAKETSDNIKEKFNEITDGKTLEEHKEEYEQAYKKSYGKTNAKELADAFLKSQKQGEQITKIALVIATTIGTMGAASAINGAALGTKAAFALSATSTGAATTGINTLDDYTKDGKVDNFKEHLIEGAKASGYSAIGFGSNAISQSIKGFGYVGKFGTELAMDATASTLFGAATGDHQTLGENFLYSGAFMLPGMAAARIKGKPCPKIEPKVKTPKTKTKTPFIFTTMTYAEPKVKVNTETPTVKLQQEPLALPPADKTQSIHISKQNMQSYSNVVAGKANVELDKAFNEVKNILPKHMQDNLTFRAKEQPSTYNKLIKKDKKNNITNLNSAINAMDDVVGTRLILEDTSPKEMNALVDNLEEAILSGDIVIVELRNYQGRFGASYFSDAHIAKLQEAVEIRFEQTGKGPEKLGVLEAGKEIKGSGYTTTQMKIIHQKGEMGESVLGEFQIRGKHINKFADIEHERYKPSTKELENAINALTPSQIKEYDEYLSALYKYYRNIESGTPNAPISVEPLKGEIINHYPAGKKPELPEGFNHILSEENLQIAYDNAKKAKNN